MYQAIVSIMGGALVFGGLGILKASRISKGTRYGELLKALGWLFLAGALSTPTGLLANAGVISSALATTLSLPALAAIVGCIFWVNYLVIRNNLKD